VVSITECVATSMNWPSTTLLNKVKGKLFSSNFLFYTNTGLSFGLSGLGDLIQQKIELKRKTVSKQNINWSRALHMSTSFGLTAGVLCHFWYSFLDRSLPGKTLRVVIQKVAIDQVFFSPVCIAACLLVSQGLHSSSLDSALNLVSHSLQLGGRLYLAEWCIWPPAQFINFLLLPPHLRVTFDNLVSLGYDCYTSHLVHTQDLSLKFDHFPHSKFFINDFEEDINDD